MKRNLIPLALVAFLACVLAAPANAGRFGEAGKRLLSRLSPETVYQLAEKAGGFAGSALRVEPSDAGGKDVLLYQTYSGRVELVWIEIPVGVEVKGDEIEECSTIGVLRSRPRQVDGEVVHVASKVAVHSDGNPARQHLCTDEVQGALMWLFLHDRPVLQDRFVRTSPGILSGPIASLPRLVADAQDLGYQADLERAAASIGMISSDAAQAMAESERIERKRAMAELQKCREEPRFVDGCPSDLATCQSTLFAVRQSLLSIQATHPRDSREGLAVIDGYFGEP